MLFEELAEEAVRQTTLEGLCPVIGKAARDCGFEYLVYARSVKRDGIGRAPEVEVLASTYPEHLIKRYLEQAYGSVDAVVRLSATTNTPFACDAVPSLCPLSEVQKTIFSEVREAGLRNGVVVPIHYPGDSVDIVCFATASNEPIAPGRALQMQAIGNLLVLRQQEFEKAARPLTATLTERERECLTWMASGKSSWEIGQIMNISDNTVRFHIKNTFQKLGCTNRVSAVVLALRLGLVRP
jgi:LuxR family quorum-sensing system transcriptional regulator CciR